MAKVIHYSVVQADYVLFEVLLSLPILAVENRKAGALLEPVRLERGEV